MGAWFSQTFCKHLEGAHQQMFCSVVLASHVSMLMMLFMKDFLLEWIFVCMTSSNHKCSKACVNKLICGQQLLVTSDLQMSVIFN